MKNKNYNELITAFIDGELKSQEELRSFESALKENPSLEFDLKTESLTKNIIKNRSIKDDIPGNTKDKIISALKKEKIKSGGEYSFKENIYSRKFIGFSTAVVVILAVILLLFNRPTGFNLPQISEQSGNDNMVVLAVNNFENYLAGNQQVEFVSSNPEEIKNYFQLSGVKYDTYIHKFDQYSLLGAFVTDQNGVKLANHIYSTKDGKYIYIFQVHENYIQSDSIIRLTNDLLNYLKLGNNYKTSQKDYVTVLKRKDNNVFAMVSNIPAEKLPEDFFK